MNQAVIGLGSNINPEENIRKARELLKEHFIVLKESRFIYTDPIGYKDQDRFLNGSVFIETHQEQDEVKAALKYIEKRLMRKRSAVRFGPRTIDLDLVVWNNSVVDQDFYERDFLKNAVLELIPDLQY